MGKTSIFLILLVIITVFNEAALEANEQNNPKAGSALDLLKAIIKDQRFINYFKTHPEEDSKVQTIVKTVKECYDRNHVIIISTKKKINPCTKEFFVLKVVVKHMFLLANYLKTKGKLNKIPENLFDIAEIEGLWAKQRRFGSPEKNETLSLSDSEVAVDSFSDIISDISDLSEQAINLLKQSGKLETKTTLPQTKVSTAPVTITKTTNATTTIGNSTIGMPTIGETIFEDSTTGKTTFVETLFEERTTGKATVGETSTPITTIGKRATEEITTEKKSIGNEIFGKETFGKETFGKEPIGKEIFGKETSGKATFEQVYTERAVISSSTSSIADTTQRYSDTVTEARQEIPEPKPTPLIKIENIPQKVANKTEHLIALPQNNTIQVSLLSNVGNATISTLTNPNQEIKIVLSITVNGKNDSRPVRVKSPPKKYVYPSNIMKLGPHHKIISKMPLRLKKQINNKFNRQKLKRNQLTPKEDSLDRLLASLLSFGKPEIDRGTRNLMTLDNILESILSPIMPKEARAKNSILEEPIRSLRSSDSHPIDDTNSNENYGLYTRKWQIDERHHPKSENKQRDIIYW